jgi:hypothetical protein
MPSASKILGDLVSSTGSLSVTNTSITGTITTAQIADSAIVTSKIADSAVVTVDIADANVTNAKIVSVANTKITGVMTASQLENTAVVAGVYGGSSNSALITIDAQGRITSASNVAAGGGQLQTQLFTAPGTWTNPGSVTRVKVTVVGGGGGGGVSDGTQSSPPGGSGGIAISMITIPTSPVAVTVGSAGTGKPAPGPGGGGSGSTSSFGSFISATGGSGGAGNQGSPPGSSGSGSIPAPVSPGALRTSNIFEFGAGVGFTTGSTTRSGPGNPVGGAVLAFSTSGSFSAGAAGSGSPQNAPAPTSGGAGGVNGVVVVEFVG